MKLILKNSSLVFQKRAPKNSYNWSEISSAQGFMISTALQKDSGDTTTNSAFNVSAPILLEGATSIQVNGADNLYFASIGFFNSETSITTAVYYVNGTGAGQQANAIFTIDSTAINAAIAAGADSFRVSFHANTTNGSIDITRPAS